MSICAKATGAWPPSKQLSSFATVTKLSDSEAESLDASVDASEGPGRFHREFLPPLERPLRMPTMCVTFGERGCAILKDGKYSQAPGLSRHGRRYRRRRRRIFRRLRPRPEPGMGSQSHRRVRQCCRVRWWPAVREPSPNGPSRKPMPDERRRGGFHRSYLVLLRSEIVTKQPEDLLPGNRDFGGGRLAFVGRTGRHQMIGSWLLGAV